MAASDSKSLAASNCGTSSAFLKMSTSQQQQLPTCITTSIGNISISIDHIYAASCMNNNMSSTSKSSVAIMNGSSRSCSNGAVLLAKKNSTQAAISAAAASDINNVGAVVCKVDAAAGSSHAKSMNVAAVATINGNIAALSREKGTGIDKVESTEAENTHGYEQYEDVGATMPGSERICGLSTTGALVSRSSTSHESKRVSKPAKALAATQQYSSEYHRRGPAGGAAELWSSKKCNRRNSKMAHAVMPTTQKSKCFNDQQAKMIVKSSSNNNHDNNNNNNNNNAVAVLHGWLQGMRETSPPRTTSPSTAAATVSSSPFDHMDALTTDEDLELIHRAWMVKHPSALDKFEEIVEAASGKRVAVFLDYDGTLSPIVEDPDRAFMSHQMRAIVKEVANVFPTAIVSGRCKEKLHEFVQLPELYYAGSHGMEIIGPARHLEETRPSQAKASEVVLFQPAKQFTYIVDKVFKDLEEKTKGVPGARVEHNKFCVSVHFRCVKERHWIALADQVQQVLQSYPNLRLTQGRKVLEIRPLIAWNKGKALDFLLKALGLNDQNSVFPIYLGDDRSDEDAFKVLNRKKHGLGILVTTVAKETNAVCSLRDPSEVGELLKRLVKWKRRRLTKYL